MRSTQVEKTMRESMRAMAANTTAYPAFLCRRTMPTVMLASAKTKKRLPVRSRRVEPYLQQPEKPADNHNHQ
jgi:3-deoxy-D-manno-octulosonic acid (KDO) 8-phosphate synthase